MTRTPRSTTAVLLTLVLAAPPGCVTRALWDTWPTSPEPAATPVPVQLERAVRTGEGAFHVLATYSDGSTRHLAVRPFEAPADAAPWPDAIRRQEIVVEVDGPLPEGAPLRVTGAAEDGLPLTDATEPVDVISLEQDALRVVNGAGESWTLATFSDAPTPGAAPVGPVEDDPARQKVLVVLFTPFTLALDAAIAVLVFGPMLPVVAEDLLAVLDGEREVQRPSRLDRYARAASSARACDSDVPSRVSTTTSERAGGS